MHHSACCTSPRPEVLTQQGGACAQWELYSSRVREFEALGRQNHPRTDGGDYARALNASAWQLLGRFTAANTKGTQVWRVAARR